MKAAPAVVVAAITLAVCWGTAHAIQPDAPFLELASKSRDQWGAEDREIDAKLEALRQRFGKRPNIIYILADDVGWGELGCYLGGKMMGRPSPTLDRLADQGMMFLSHYAEPSCTPTRLAILTGRHPVRTGVNTVLWPGGPSHVGLHPEEATVAEVLSAAGYHTAMWGKWHVGDEPEHAPENQGFDYAHYGLFNGAVWFWLDVEGHYKDREIVTGAHPFHDFPGVDEYREKYGIDIASKGYYRGIKGKGRQVSKRLTSSKDMEDFEDLSIKEIRGFIHDKAATDRPFFIYWATYFHQDAASPREYRLREGVDYVNNQAAQSGQHNDHLAQLVQTLKDEGIEENTLLVWVSDNGPMDYFWPNGGYSWLRGHKGDVLEGGVRTPGIAYWPGTIQPRQKPIDMIHVVDLFTTAARVGGAIDRIPNDRVTDGVDQTALLLLGEGHSRRNYLFHYSGPRLGAVRWGNLKMHMGQEKGGVPQNELYNIMRDPREEHAHESTGSMLAHVIPFQRFVRSHMAMKEKYPDRVLRPEK